MSFEDLSYDELLYIFQYLNTKEKLTFGQTSKFINNVSLDNYLWKNEYKMKWYKNIKDMNNKALSKIKNQKSFKINDLDLLKNDLNSIPQFKKQYTTFMNYYSKLLTDHSDYYNRDDNLHLESFCLFLTSDYIFILIYLFLQIIDFLTDYKEDFIRFSIYSFISLIIGFSFFIYLLFLISNSPFKFYYYDQLYKETEFFHEKPLIYKLIHWSIQQLWIIYLIVVNGIKLLIQNLKISYLMIPEFFIILLCFIFICLEKTKHQTSKIISYFIFYTFILIALFGFTLNFDLGKEIIHLIKFFFNQHLKER